MLIIRLVMVHMGPKHTQYGHKTARLAPVLQNGLKGHVGALRGAAIASRRAAARGRAHMHVHVYEVLQLSRWGSGLGHRSGTLGRSADAPLRNP